jgi:hypothetical protein
MIIGYSASLRSKVQVVFAFSVASNASPCADGSAALPSGRSTALIARLSIKKRIDWSNSDWLKRSSVAIAASGRQSSRVLPSSFSRFNARNSFRPSFSGGALTFSSNEIEISGLAGGG